MEQKKQEPNFRVGCPFIVFMLPAMPQPEPPVSAARVPVQVVDPAVAQDRVRSTRDRAEEHGLCARVAEGDDEAFSILVERYQHRVFGFCARMIGDRAEAEDLAQDVFLTLYRNAGNFRGESAFSTWLFRIAKNQTLNRIKYLERRGRSARRRERDSEARLSRVADETALGPDDIVANRERATMVQAAIDELGEEHRAVVVLRDMEDMSYEEISEITGLPLGTVKSRIHRARSALAKRLSRIFG